MISSLTPEQIVKMDKEAIYLGNIFTLDNDLNLPTQGKFGSKIVWHSDNERFLTSTGKIHRPEFGKGNRKVILTATVSYEGVSDTRTFEVTVLELEPDYSIVEVCDTNLHFALGDQPQLPSVVIIKKNDSTFSTSEVKWNITNPELFLKKGSFKIYGSVSRTNIKAVANITINGAGEEDKINSTVDTAVHPFSLNRVSLMDDIFSANRDRGEAFLLSVDDDRMLYNFRDAAGLDKKDAPPMVGWDSPESKLKGHTTGHYLSALAHAYMSSGDERFKQKIDYMVSELGKCQDAMEASSKYGYGFLSAYSEEQFDKLEEYTPYPEIWAPYYTLHKIIAGLLDCYELGGNKQALEISKKIGTWVFNRLSRLDRSKLSKMWSMYIAGEFGGMNEVMARLYGITKNEDYLKAAHFFDNDKLFVPMENNVDTLCNMHANQHIPQVLGALRIYSETKDIKYYNIAKNFWEMVVSNHTYNIGGVGEGEMLKAPNKIGSFISEKTAETCATYNMLKLTKELFTYNPDPKYMDYYERALYNHILASQDQRGPVGGSTYFMPLCPGGKKIYDEEENSCCHGTGMENHVKYQEAIYFHCGDTLYVNLYIPSKLNWVEKGVDIIQSGEFLKDNVAYFEIQGSSTFTIRFRVPSWAVNGFYVKVNGKEEKIEAKPSSYVSLNRNWKDGDRIEVYIPFAFRIERTPDVPELASIMYGPIVMVGSSSTTEYIELDIDESNISNKIKPTDTPLIFKIDDLILVPNYMAWNIPYHAYFKISNTNCNC